MIAEGANPLMVQRQLGHADLRMTLGTYGHLFPHWDDEVAGRMQRPVAANETRSTRGLYAV
jgi:integrase